MNNESFLQRAKAIYESLQYFSIIDNYLIFNYNGTFKIAFSNVSLANLNPNLYLIHPSEIFQILYVLELLYKENLTESESKFIENYTEKYLKISTKAINNESSNTNRLWCLSIPIYTSYDPNFINLPGAILIQNILKEQKEDINSGKSLQPKLVLIKDDIIPIEEDDAMKNFYQAGFTTLILITSTVIITVAYIVYFMNFK